MTEVESDTDRPKFTWGVTIPDDKRRPLTRSKTLTRVVRAALNLQGSGYAKTKDIAGAIGRSVKGTIHHLRRLEKVGLATRLGERGGWKVFSEAIAYADDVDNAPREYEVEIGERYGTREVVGEMFLVGSTPYTTVRCDCGVESDVQANSLKAGLADSCRRCREVKRAVASLRSKIDAASCEIVVRFENGFSLTVTA